MTRAQLCTALNAHFAQKNTAIRFEVSADGESVLILIKDPYLVPYGTHLVNDAFKAELTTALQELVDSSPLYIKLDNRPLNHFSVWLDEDNTKNFFQD